MKIKNFTDYNEGILNIFKKKPKVDLPEKDKKTLDDKIEYLNKNSYFRTYRDLMHYIDTLEEAVLLLKERFDKYERETYYITMGPFPSQQGVPVKNPFDKGSIEDYLNTLKNIYNKLVRVGSRSNDTFREIEVRQVRNIRNILDSIKF